MEVVYQNIASFERVSGRAGINTEPMHCQECRPPIAQANRTFSTVEHTAENAERRTPATPLGAAVCG